MGTGFILREIYLHPVEGVKSRGKRSKSRVKENMRGVPGVKKKGCSKRKYNFNLLHIFCGSRPEL